MLPFPIHLLSQDGIASPISSLPETTQGSVQTAIEGFISPTNAEDLAQEPHLTVFYSDITQFAIHIPAINLNQNIIANVHPGDDEKYLPIIEKSVAHGKYTALPNEKYGNTYLFAHSRLGPENITPDGGWFTRIDELEAGDVILLQFNDKTYSYIMKSREIVEPSETTVYTGETLFEGKRSLTLQTCYPRGTTDQRLLVYAVEE